MTEFLFFNTQSTKVNRFDSIEQSFLDRLYKTIEDKLGDEKFGVAELAEEIGVSKSQLHRRLHSLSNQSASQIIREHRLKKAMEMLENEVGTVADISYLVGFGSPSYFITCFHEYYGYPPGEVKIRKSLEKKRNPLTYIKRLLISLSALALLSLIYFSLSLTGIISNKTTKSLTPEKSIAVLSFEDRSPEQDQEYLGDGMAEEIMTILSKNKTLKVIARRSSFQFKGKNIDVRDVGDRLGVQHVLEGSISKVNNRLRVSAHLVKTSDGATVWSEVYDKNMDDIFSIQNLIASTILENMHINVVNEDIDQSIKPSTYSIEAYNLYLLGNHQLMLQIQKFDDMALKKAMEYYREAIALDNNYAEPYSGLAFGYYMSTLWSGTEKATNTVIDSAKLNVSKALEINNSLAEAHIVDGLIKWVYDWDWKGAELAFERGMKLKPNFTLARSEYANFLTCMGKFDEAISVCEKTMEIDPVSAFPYLELAFALGFLGQENKALEMLKKGREIEPGNIVISIGLLHNYALWGSYDDFMEEWANLGFQNSTQVPTRLLPYFSYYFAVMGRLEEATKYLDEFNKRTVDQYIPNIKFTIVYIGLKNYDKAIKYIEKAYIEHEPGLIYLKVHHFYDSIRNDPRFVKIINDMNF